MQGKHLQQVNEIVAVAAELERLARRETDALEELSRLGFRVSAENIRYPQGQFKLARRIRSALEAMHGSPCVVCGRFAPLVDRECPDCRH